jgi:hypothetical protein
MFEAINANLDKELARIKRSIAGTRISGPCSLLDKGGCAHNVGTPL